MSSVVGSPTSPMIKYLIAVADDTLRAHVVKYIGKHFSETRVYEAKDGSEAVQKIEADTPHVLILDDKLARRTSAQIIKWVYEDTRTRNIQSILLNAKANPAATDDLLVSGYMQLVTVQSNLDPLVAAIYKAINRLEPDNKNFSIRYARKGEVILKEGEKGDCLYVLNRGKLTAFLGTPENPQVLGHIVPGEFVGEMAYINGEPRVASVVADEDSELVQFQIETFDQMLYRKPSWMKALLQTLTRRVKVANRKQTKSTAPAKP